MLVAGGAVVVTPGVGGRVTVVAKGAMVVATGGAVAVVPGVGP